MYKVLTQIDVAKSEAFNSDDQALSHVTPAWHASRLLPIYGAATFVPYEDFLLLPSLPCPSSLFSSLLPSSHHPCFRPTYILLQSKILGEAEACEGGIPALNALIKEPIRKWLGQTGLKATIPQPIHADTFIYFDGSCVSVSVTESHASRNIAENPLY